TCRRREVTWMALARSSNRTWSVAGDDNRLTPCTENEVLVAVAMAEIAGLAVPPGEERHASGHLADPGRRSRHSAVSADADPEQARRSHRRQVSTDRYTLVKLHSLGHQPHLRADAVQFRESAPAHLQHVQV